MHYYSYDEILVLSRTRPGRVRPRHQVLPHATSGCTSPRAATRAVPRRRRCRRSCSSKRVAEVDASDRASRHAVVVERSSRPRHRRQSGSGTRVRPPVRRGRGPRWSPPVGSPTRPTTSARCPVRSRCCDSTSPTTTTSKRSWPSSPGARSTCCSATPRSSADRGRASTTSTGTRGSGRSTPTCSAWPGWRRRSGRTWPRPRARSSWWPAVQVWPGSRSRARRTSTDRPRRR